MHNNIVNARRVLICDRNNYGCNSMTVQPGSLDFLCTKSFGISKKSIVLYVKHALSIITTML